MRKHGLKALVLTVMAALGLMAFSASSALAANLNIIDEPETTEVGKFLIKSGTENPTGLTTETIAGTSTKEGRLLIPGKSSEIDCASGKLTSGVVANEYENFKTATMKKGGHGKGTVLFENCKVFKTTAEGIKGEEIAACTNVLNGATSPHNVTAKGLLRVAKHEGATYLVVEPEITSKANAEENEKLTSAFTTLKFGGTCSLPESVKVTGGIVAKPAAADANKPVIALVKTWEVAAGVAKRSTEQVLLGAILKFGANEAFIEAKEIVTELTGAGNALLWGAM